VRALAVELGYGERQLRRRTMQHFGLSPSALILQRRLTKGRELILARRYESKAEVAHAVGLSPGYFTRRYRTAYPD
jgi:AraC-like DNA-binding protein